MGSPAPVPSRDTLANYPPQIGDELVKYEQQTVWKQPVRLASAATIANLSSVTVADFDGTGQGKTLAAGDRVLVKNNASKDGIEGTAGKRQAIYVVGAVASGSAPLTRDADANTSAMVTSGMNCLVMEGTYAGQTWTLTTANPIILDTTALTFALSATTANATSGAPGLVQLTGGLSGTGSTATLPILNVGAGNVSGVLPAANLAPGARNVVVSNIANLAAYTVASGSANDNVSGGNVQNDRVLLVAQSTAAQNGLYAVGVVGGGTAALTRVADVPAGAVAAPVVEISEGAVFAGKPWKSFATTAGGPVAGANDPVYYPRHYTRITTAMSGTPGIKALSAEWIFSATNSMVKWSVKVPGTQGFLSVGTLTAGAGTGSCTITSTANETSTLYVEVSN